MLLPTNGCWEFNHIPFIPLCLWSNKQTNHEQNTWQHVNCRVLGSKHASQFSTNQLIVTEFGWAVSKVSSEKNFDRPARLLQDWLVLFSVHTCMYDEFHVPDVLLHCCTCEGYWFKQKQSCQLLMSNFPNYTRQLYKHIHVVHYISLTFLLLLLSHKIRIGLDCDNAALVNCLLR